MIERSMLVSILLATAGTAVAEGAAAQTPAQIAAAMARIDPVGVSIQAVSPDAAHAWKTRVGSGALLIDIRGWDEVESTGTAEGVDAVVPFRTSGRSVPASDAGFVATVWAQVAARGGDPDTPILLLCRSGTRARAAARDLTLAGLGDVHPISGGFEGELEADGQRSGGWKASLPWQPFIDRTALSGSSH